MAWTCTACAQYDAGGYAQNCSTQFELSAGAAVKGRGLYIPANG
jgi:hypothetical protein